jgi:glucose/arabinose dehydrogenase
MGRTFLLASAVPLLGAAFAGPFLVEAAAQTTASANGAPLGTPGHTHGFRVETVADGLFNPWSIAFLPDGDILVTERPGRLRIIRDGALDPRPIAGVPAVFALGQAGLLDVVLHPDYETNRLIYLSYTKRAGGNDTPAAPDVARTAVEAVARGRFDGQRLLDLEEIFEARLAPSAGGVSAMAGRLAFDREGYLYLTVGDRFTPTRDIDLTRHVAQDLSNHMGKTLRLHDDGRVPSDNPFVGVAGALPEIWSYGHRNSQGMAFHPATHELWQSESGAQGGDELNVIRRGANYGWPVIGFSREYSGVELHDAAAREGMEQPVHHWTPACVPSGMMFYTGDRFPSWNGNIFVACLGGEQLSRIVVDGQRFVAEEVLLDSALGRLRDVRQGPDGLLYLAIDGREGARPVPTRIVRLVPQE